MKTPREILIERHQGTEPKLAAIRQRAVAQLSAGDEGRSGEARSWVHAFVDSFRVPRWAWGGMATAWLIILALNLASSDTPNASVTVAQTPPGRSLETRQALLEQRRLFAEMVGTLAAPMEAEAPRFVPRPRSDARPQLTFA